MTTNPFDDTSGLFRVLLDAEGRHCLWPVFAVVPTGWTVVHGEGAGVSHADALEYVSEHWTDMRPVSSR